MLSKKLTFSLTSLVMLLAIGLVFVPAVLAGVDTEPEPTLNSVDVSAATGPQLEVFEALATLPIATDVKEIDTQSKIDALLTTGKLTTGIEFFIRLKTGMAALDERGANVSNPDNNDAPSIPGTTVAVPLIEGASLHIHDFSIGYFDKNGVPIRQNNSMERPVNLISSASIISHRTVSFPDGRNFRVQISAKDIPDDARYMTAVLPAGVFQNAEPDAIQAAHLDKDKSLKTNKESEVLRLILVKQEPSGDAGDPQLVSIVRVVPTAAAATSRFTSAAVTGRFDVRITFTEEPKDFTLANIGDRLDIENGIATEVLPGTPFYLSPDASEGDYIAGTDPVPAPTGRDGRYHSYLVKIAPNVPGATFVEIRAKAFDDLVLPPNSWVPPTNLSLVAGRHLLRVAVTSGTVEDVFADIDPGTATVKSETKLDNEVFLPEKLVIPANGYLVLAVGKPEHHGIQDSPAKIADKKTAAQKAYNLKSEFGLPYPGTDLDTFFRIGGTIELYHRDITANKPDTGAAADENGYLLSNKTYASGAVVVSEIMWGRDSSLGGADTGKSQWIELHNTTTEAISIDKHEWVLAFIAGSGSGTSGTFGLTLIDTVSNASPYWVAPGEGGATQSSRQVEVNDEVVAIETFEIGALQSMYRKIDGSNVMNGTSADSWAASTTVGSRNFSGLRVGTPGAATSYTTPPLPEPEPTPTAPVAKGSDIMISEIMVTSNEGRLPQWIELANVSGAEVSLMGWSVDVDNDSADADVIAESVNVELGDVTVGKDQVVLVVTKTGRNSGVGTGAGNLRADRIVNVQSQISPTDARYSLISEMAFKVALLPPQKGGVVERGDVIGNLGMGWELPMAEGARSSIIRREMGDAGEIMGTDAAGWVLAADTNLDGAYRTTYYGNDEDVGTPGFNAGGALPVELSMFTAARDRLTGQVTIAWETQSELNNAGFFIKRSQQQTGQFKVVNPTMIAGAGTTSEKQTYTYTDTTAQPNIVYYYQIEDVSLDGNRQTLTRAHRLKGHIGAAGKLTILWGTLKAQE